MGGKLHLRGFAAGVGVKCPTALMFLCCFGKASTRPSLAYVYEGHQACLQVVRYYLGAAQAAAAMAFLMNKAFLGASLGAQNGSKTIMMAKVTKIVKKAAQQVASKVGGGSAKGFRRYQGARTLLGCAGCQGQGHEHSNLASVLSKVS